MNRSREPLATIISLSAGSLQSATSDLGVKKRVFALNISWRGKGGWGAERRGKGGGRLKFRWVEWSKGFEGKVENPTCAAKKAQASVCCKWRILTMMGVLGSFWVGTLHTSAANSVRILLFMQARNGICQSSPCSTCKQQSKGRNNKSRARKATK